MKKLVLTLSIVAALMSSCTEDSVVIDSPIVENVIKGGDLVESITLSGEYKLDGALYVKSGATLTIEAGTTIEASDLGVGAFILVERGAKIVANGTASSPITFTSVGTTPGSWGGLIINGYAPIAGGGESATEIATVIKFGGDDATDNSGQLSYVIIENTGASINDEAEHNGLTLNGVGSGTSISNIAIMNGDDDGIEFFGGSVDVTNLLVVDAKDDMFDFTMGYTGKVTNAYGVRNAGYLARTSDPRGIEADGNKDGKYPEHTGQSDFEVENITIVNHATCDDQETGSGRLDDAIKVRRGAKATITNALIKSTVAGNVNVKDVIDLVDKRGAAEASSTLSVSIDGDITWKVGTETDNEAGDGTVTFEGDIPSEVNNNVGTDSSVFGTWTGFTKW